MLKYLKSTLVGAASVAILATAAPARNFNIPDGDLSTALNTYMAQSGAALVISLDAVKGVRTRGVKGDLPADAALTRILSGTGFVAQRDSGVVAIIRQSSSSLNLPPMQLAQATPPPRSAVETVTVTSSKLGGADVQSIPISITALSQEQLTASQTNGGPDLIKQVPNMTFTKTNFSGYSIQIRGIGTQAISVTTDPAVAVAMNDMPFLRNHFFEQEFYDLAQIEVLRGPQGTLYGRNATAGVVNLTTAKPTDQFEAMASAEIGNYQQRRFEGMINLPIVDDRLDIRLAGEWTKRQGYSFNETTDEHIDGRDLWSGRATIGIKPTSNVQAYLIWEHFQESDDRLRSGKQLCKKDPGPESIGGVDIPKDQGGAFGDTAFTSQGCLPASLYSAESFQTPNGFALPYYGPTRNLGLNPVFSDRDPYASQFQSRNLRVIESQLEPDYKVKNDTVQFNVDYNVTPALIFTSQTGFNNDFLWSTEDYNRFNTTPNAFDASLAPQLRPGEVSSDGVFCDPQLGCSKRLLAEDLVTSQSWQLSQEFRLASHFDGPFNFSVGGNYLHYETMEKYYVFINTLSSFVAGSGGTLELPYIPGVTDNMICINGNAAGRQYADPTQSASVQGCQYMDPNPIGKLNDKGHNYFLSKNPYTVNSYALFGETYYDITKDLKLTGGLRWTDDQKHFVLIPSELLAGSTWGYPILGNVDQSWSEFTGRAAVNWTPKLSFTDQTLFFGSYAHGYKAGGANPPTPIVTTGGGVYDTEMLQSFTHPQTFKPEFIDAFELGTKNMLLDGAITFNASAFYYNYENYQISEIVDRTSINQNFDAHIKGAEIEAVWEPVPGLRFNFSGGYEDAHLAKGSKAIDLTDRTAGNPDWYLLKPFPSNTSNCILPISIPLTTGSINPSPNGDMACMAYKAHVDPVTGVPYVPVEPGEPVLNKYGTPILDSIGNPNLAYRGFDPSTAPNNGEGFFKDLSGNEMPNAPPWTASFGAQYSMPLSTDWAGTLRGDFYWQSNSYWRVFNDNAYDQLHGYTNFNLTLILTNQSGWQVMLYDKNVFNTTAITGAFLNSDDSGLTTNVFLTDPKLIGIRVTKNW